MPTSKLGKGSLTRTRSAEDVDIVRLDATAVESLATSLDIFQTKMNKKAMIQVKIRSKKGKYTSILRTRTSAAT